MLDQEILLTSTNLRIAYLEELYNFSVDYNSVGKSDILNFRKYLMTKNNIN